MSIWLSRSFADHYRDRKRVLGFRFAPRLRDLGDRKLYSIESPALYPNLDLLWNGWG